MRDSLVACAGRIARAAGRWFPAPCIGCGQRAGPRGACETCVRLLPWNRSPCPRCAVAVIDASSPCGPCLVAPPAWHAARSAFVYEPPVTGLLHEFKFGRRLGTGRTLALLAAHWFAASAQPLPEALVPVPLHWRRRMWRNFNQADEIASCWSRRLGVPLAPICRRVRATPAQSTLTAPERRSNLRGAFRLVRTPAVRHIAIVDDVLTTGSTAAAMTRVLAQAGYGPIEVWTLARASRPAKT